MFPVALLRHGLCLLLPLAVASTLYLYLYPAVHGCGFPVVPEPGADNGPRAAFEEAALGRFEYYLGHLPPQFDPVARVARKLVAGTPGPGRKSRAAPFRLLCLGDPQLEGATSIPHPFGPDFPYLKSFFRHAAFLTDQYSLRHRIKQCLHDLIDFFLEDIPNEIESWRKRVDLLGNDFYLAHVYRSVDWWSEPTHVVAMGDLVGSQWIDDDEFDRRAHRYWQRVLRGTERVPDHLALYPANEYDLSGYLGQGARPGAGAATGSGTDLGNGTITYADADADPAVWRRRVINVAGNHDIGYAGDLTVERLERFERAFGKANYELRFELPLADPAANATVFHDMTNPDSDRLVPELRVVVLNDMNLDTPALTPELQDASYAFVNALIGTSTAVEFRGHFTVLLTHVPMYKPEGICVDAPFFDFHPEDMGGGVKEQNQLSEDVSRGFLEGIFGMSGDTSAPGAGQGRRGVILNGHDHEGCDTYHYINQSSPYEERWWAVRRWKGAEADGLPDRHELPGVREITVRSMMGDFGGNAGLLSAWFDEGAWEWRVEYATCSLGRQHIWWVVHIVDALVIVATAAYAVLAVFGAPEEGKGAVGKENVPVVAPRPPAARVMSPEVRVKTEANLDGDGGAADRKAARG